MFEKRVNMAVISKIDTSITCLLDGLCDVGIPDIELSWLRDHIRENMKNKLQEPTREVAESALLQFGLDPESSPQFIANIIVWQTISKLLKDIEEVVQAMLEAESTKLKCWLSGILTEDCVVDLASLLVLNKTEDDSADLSDELVEAVLKAGREVMEVSAAELREFIKSSAGEDQTIYAFTRDLAIAWLDNDRTAELIRNIMAITDWKVIKDLIQKMQQLDTPHKNPLIFLAVNVSEHLKRAGCEEEETSVAA